MIKNLNRYIDHTKLGFNVSKDDLNTLLQEALKYNFFSVCIPPVWVKVAKEVLAGSEVSVCTVVGFPHGNSISSVKLFETEEALKDGADEIDMVINVERVKSRDDVYLINEISSIVKACNGKIVKVIIETSMLDDEDIKYASNICVMAGAHYVKTSTGFGSRGASFEDVSLIKQTIGDSALIKASGGVRTYDDAAKMIELGASRIGTSRGVSLVQNIVNEDNKDY